MKIDMAVCALIWPFAIAGMMIFFALCAIFKVALGYCWTDYPDTRGMV